MRLSYPHPKNEDDFEELCLRLLQAEWKMPGLQRHGKRGEAQCGIDLIDPTQSGPLDVAQCKLRSTQKGLSPKEIRDEIEQLKKCPYGVRRYAILTTAKRTSESQKEITKLNQSECFLVELYSWDDIQSMLNKHPHVVLEFYQTIPGLLAGEILQELKHLQKNCSVNSSIPLMPFALSEDPETLKHKLSLVADRILNETNDIGLVAAKAQVRFDVPLLKLFQPLPLRLIALSETDKLTLTINLSQRPTETEMTAFDEKNIARRAEEYVQNGVASNDTHSIPTSNYVFDNGMAGEVTETHESNSIDTIFEQTGTALQAPRLVILGSPGGGKTVLLKYYAQCFAHGRRLKFRGRQLLPIWIRLSSWCEFVRSKGVLKLEAFLAFAFPDLDENQWLQQLDGGFLLLLFDGLDEIEDPNGDFVSRGIKRVFQKERCPIVISCRTLAYPIYQTVFKSATIFGLGPLSRESILNYAMAYSSARMLKKGKLESQISILLQIPSLRDLAGIPLLLSVMCYVLSDNKIRTAHLTVRAQLFNDAVARILSHDRQKRTPLSGSLKILRRSVIEEASLELFECLTGQDEVVQIDGDTVISSFQNAATKAGLKTSDGLEIMHDAIESGLIVFEELSPDKTVCRYLHLQFHEYLAGCALTRDGQFVHRVFNRLSSPRWREVILLAIGQLAVDGHRGGNAFLPIVEHFLTCVDPFGKFLPRAALLLVEAIPHLSNLPNQMIQRLAESILLSYANLDLILSFPDLARQLERAFTRLHEISAGEHVLPTLLNHLSALKSSPSRGMAAASFIRIVRFYNADTIGLLLANYGNDDPTWQWPIDEALRDAASDKRVSYLLDAKVNFRCLKNDPDEWSRFAGNPFWQWVAFVLFGGHDTGKFSEYHKIKGKIDSTERDLKGVTGNNAADQAEKDRLTKQKQALDESQKELKATLHVLLPENFHRPSALAPYLWDVFKRDVPVSNVIAELLARLPNIYDENERIDAILCLAHSVPVTSLVAHIRDAECFIKALTRIGPTLKILVEPAMSRLFDESLEIPLYRRIEEEDYGRQFCAISRAAGVYTSTQPLNLKAVMHTVNSDEKASRLAECWQRSFQSDSDDRVYNWCVLLDTIGKPFGGHPDILVRALAFAHNAGNAKPWNSNGWPLDPLAPQLKGRSLPALLGQAIDALGAIPPALDFVRGWALGRLAPLFNEAGMRDESRLSACMTVTNRFGALRQVFRDLCDDDEFKLFSKASLSNYRVLVLGRDSTDPFIQARTLIAALWHFGRAAQTPEQVAPILDLIEKVEDPLLREWLCERLCIIVEPTLQSQILKNAWKAVGEIRWDDFDNRSRAVIRLTAFDSMTAEDVLATHLEELDQELLAFDALQPDLRAQALAILYPYVRGLPRLVNLFDRARSKLADEKQVCSSQGLITTHVQEAVRVAGQNLPELSAAAVIYDFRHLLDIPNDIDGLWLATATADRVKAVEKLSETTMPLGLRLTRAGTLAFARLLKQEDWQTIYDILPLLRHVDITALPMMWKLRTHSNGFVRSLAVLHYAESIGLRSNTLPELVNLLKNPEYSVRARAALVMHGDRSDTSLPIYASQLGGEFFEVISSLISCEAAIDIRTTLVISWTLERVVWDDPALVESLVKSASNQQDAKAEGALRILSQIERMTPDCWDRYVALLPEIQPKVRRALLKSVCGLAQSGSISEAQVIEFAQAVSKIDISGASDFYLIENGPDAIITAASKVLNDMEQVWVDEQMHDRGEVASACRSAFSTAKTTLSSLLSALPTSEWLVHLRSIGSLRKAGPTMDQKLTSAAQRVESRPEIIRILVPWLLEELSDEDCTKPSGDYIYRCGDLLGVVADAAERFPGDYITEVSKYPTFSMRLAEASKATNTFPGRQAAFRLLSVVGVIDHNVSDAFCASLRDVVTVQTTVFECLRYFKEIHPEFVCELLQKLKNAVCPTTSYLAAQALMAVAHNVFLPADIRSKIILGWQEALTAPGLDRDVYFLNSQKENGQETYRLTNLGRLDRLLYQHLIELSGVALTL